MTTEEFVNNFYKERFTSLDGLSLTIRKLSNSKDGQNLLHSADGPALVKARLRIARLEVSSLMTQSKIIEEKIQSIKNQYQPGVL